MVTCTITPCRAAVRLNSGVIAHMFTSPSQAKAIAETISHGEITERPLFYLSIVALAFVASVVGGFVSGYAKRRGEALATKADLKALQDQLRENTRLTEEIKGDVHSRYSEQASIRLALRERTELLILSTYELEQFLSQTQVRSASGEITVFDESPMSKVSTYKEIYFPEVSEEHSKLRSTYFDYVKWLIDLRGKAMKVAEDHTALQHHLSGFKQAYGPFFASLEPFRASVIAAARARGGL